MCPVNCKLTSSIKSGQMIIFHQPRIRGFPFLSYILGAQVLWGRYNLTKQNRSKHCAKFPLQAYFKGRVNSKRDLKSWTRQLNSSAASAIKLHSLKLIEPLKIDHLKRKFHLPTINLQERTVGFNGFSKRHVFTDFILEYTGTPINTALHFQLRAKLQVLGCWDKPKLRPEIYDLNGSVIQLM